jgi:hypothetical protein
LTPKARILQRKIIRYLEAIVAGRVPFHGIKVPSPVVWQPGKNWTFTCDVTLPSAVSGEGSTEAQLITAICLYWNDDLRAYLKRCDCGGFFQAKRKTAKLCATCLKNRAQRKKVKIF